MVRPEALGFVHPCKLPPGALLDAYAQSGAYTDCYCVELGRTVTHSEFVEAFYTSGIFKIERWLLGWLAGSPSTDAQAHQLATQDLRAFAAWSVEQRGPNQIVLAAGRTRSWLMTTHAQGAGGGTKLFFGSAIVPRRGVADSGSPQMGWQFEALLGFHKVYSRVLLAAACRKLAGAG